MDNYLKVTFSIPTFNSQMYLKSCLDSILVQDYPKEKIEIIIADGGSTDKTFEVAAQYTKLIFENKRRLGEYGTAAAAKNATGDLFVVFAVDNALVGNDWLKKVSEVFTMHQDLSCCWGKMIASSTDPAIMHYYELIQSEPLAFFLNKNLNYYLKNAQREEIQGIKVDFFAANPKKPLCWGANGIVYRLKAVKNLFSGENYIGDNETFQYMVEAGKNKAAYSFDLNIYHHTVNSIWRWVSKWKRNYTQIFLKTRHERRIDWFYYGNFKLKMIFWLIYSLIPIFSISHSIYLAIRDRNIYWFYHPLMCFLQTCTYIYWTLALPQGRRALVEHLARK